MRKLITYTLSSIVLLMIVWYMILQGRIACLSTVFYQVRDILLCPQNLIGLVVFLFLYLLSILARGCRYILLAHSVNEKVSLWTCLKVILIGRAYTLVTPTALLGGQPISYFVMNISGVKHKTSGMILLMTVLLDFLFFLFISPFLCIRLSECNGIGTPFSVFFILTTVIGWGFFILCCISLWNGGNCFCRLFGGVCRMIPFLRRFELEEAFKDWLIESRKSLVSLIRSPWLSLGVAVVTVLGYLPHYLGVCYFLKNICVNMDIFTCLQQTLLINFTTLIFSPGAGSVTGDYGFVALFEPYLAQENLLAVCMIFNALSFWFPILIGLVASFMLLWNNRKSTVQIRLTDYFLAENSKIEKIVLTTENLSWEQEVKDDQNFVFVVEKGKEYTLLGIYREKGKDTLASFKVDKDCFSIELGKKDFPDYAYCFAWYTILKAKCSAFCVRLFLPFIYRRICQKKSFLFRKLGGFFQISDQVYEKSVSEKLFPLLGFWDKLDGNRRDLIKKSICGYVESRILRKTLQKKEGWWMPAVLSLQVTNDCNLHCLGCQVSCVKKPDVESRFRMLRYFLKEFHANGGRHVLLLGGEPLMLGKRLVDLTSLFPDIVFILFSNSTLLTDEIAAQIARCNNVVSLLSVDGTPEDTNHRRGPMVFEKVLQAQNLLNKYQLLNGISVMLHKGNAETLRNLDFLKQGFGLSHQFVMFVTYTNTYDHDDVLALELPEQMRFYREVCRERQKGYPFYFLPQDEMLVHGGCGGLRGIFHINENGDLVKCPFSFDRIEYTQLLQKGFKVAFQSIHINQDHSICTANFVTMQKLLEKNI